MEAFEAEYMTLAATARITLRTRTEPLTLRLLLGPSLLVHTGDSAHHRALTR